MNEALVNLYRCPEDLANVRLTDELSPQAGYFSFGSGTICYGRTTFGTPAENAGDPLRDLFQRVVLDGGSTLRLPFDPSEIVDNLRLERYIANGYAGLRGLLSSERIRAAYYYLRPLLGISGRKHIQRLFLRNWDKLLFPSWPVDTTVEDILARLLFLIIKSRNLERIPFIWFWPEGASACVMLTHDVETKDGLRFVPRLMDTDETFGIKSSFQVIPEGRYPVSSQLLAAITARGFEIAIHDLHHNGNFFDDRRRFLGRARKVNQYLQEYGAQGFRSGRMYRNLDWYDALNVSYDMSVPNVAHLDPQRGGCCTVFPFFVGKVLELPLTTIQDYSLFHVLSDYSIDLWKKQISLIMERHGLASFIIHSDYVMKEKELAIYRTLLEYLCNLSQKTNTWVALPREVNRWWRDRSQTRLQPDGAGWRMQESAQQRARIAYASIKDDRLVYTFATDETIVASHSNSASHRTC